MGNMRRRFAAGIAAAGLALGTVVATPIATADPVTLPAMTPGSGGPIIGGGGGGGLAQQLIGLGKPNVQEVDGSDAAQFINAAATVSDPALSAPFTLLRRALTCQTNNAGWAARAYRRNDGRWGGAMLVTSKSTNPNTEALVSCAKTNWRRPSAGSETAMCNNGWTTPTMGATRNSEVYYIMLAGTADDVCSALNDKFKTNAGGWPA